MGIDLSWESAPDATTLLKFRRQLEESKLTERIFAAPSSTKNQGGERDPEMHQTQKGNQWHCGMKLHIGVDADTGIAHTLVTTPASTNDVTQAHALLHGEERIVFGDAGSQGVEKREENQSRDVQWEVAMRPGKRKALPDTPLGRINE